MTLLPAFVSRRHRRPGGSVVLVTDSFTRTDNPSVLGSTESGSAGVLAWQILAGTWGVLTNQARVSVTSGNPWAVVNAGVADVTVSAVLNSITLEGGIIARVTDASNGYRFVWSGGSLYLQKQVAGAFTTLAGPTARAFTAGERYALKCSGSSLTASIAGVTVLTATDATFTTQTKHGLELVNTSDLADDFLVTAP